MAVLGFVGCDRSAYSPPEWLDWGSIEVRVSNDRGHALANLRVEVRHLTNRTLRFRTTNGDGYASFVQIEAGPWSIRAAAPAGHVVTQDSVLVTVSDGQVSTVDLLFPANWQRLTGELIVNAEGGAFRPCGEASYWHYRFLDWRLDSVAFFRWNELSLQGGTPIWATFDGYAVPVDNSVFPTMFVIDSIIDMMPKPAYRCPT